MDINKFIFSRTAPAKKIEAIEVLSQPELLSITPTTIAKMVKDTGTRLYKSRDKRMHIANTVSNDWNAEFIGIKNFGTNPLAEIYLQYDSTDTNVSIPFEDFLRKGDFRGSITRTDRYDNPQTHYFTFRETDKAIVLGRLLMDYLNRKYTDRSS